MNVAMLGPQGSGKGTQAQKLAEKFGLIRVETGKMLRDIAATNTEEAKEIRNIMQEGKLVPDDILQKVVKDKLSLNGGNGFVLDGTPRNRVQYDLIKKTLNEMGQNLDRVIFLNIDREETINRLSNRRTCEKCNRIYNLSTDPPPRQDTCECGGKLIQRPDDTEAAITKRLDEYNRETVPIMDKARQDGILLEVDGTKSIDAIHELIIQNLNLK